MWCYDYYEYEQKESYSLFNSSIESKELLLFGKNKLGVSECWRVQQIPQILYLQFDSSITSNILNSNYLLIKIADAFEEYLKKLCKHPLLFPVVAQWCEHKKTCPIISYPINQDQHLESIQCESFTMCKLTFPNHININSKNLKSILNVNELNNYLLPSTTLSCKTLWTESATIIERFLLDKQIFGPCWMENKQYNTVLDNERVTNSTVELNVNWNDIVVGNCSPPLCKLELRVLYLSLTTEYEYKNNDVVNSLDGIVDVTIKNIMCMTNQWCPNNGESSSSSTTMPIIETFTTLTELEAFFQINHVDVVIGYRLLDYIIPTLCEFFKSTPNVLKCFSKLIHPRMKQKFHSTSFPGLLIIDAFKCFSSNDFFPNHHTYYIKDMKQTFNINVSKEHPLSSTSSFEEIVVVSSLFHMYSILDVVFLLSKRCGHPINLTFNFSMMTMITWMLKHKYHDENFVLSNIFEKVQSQNTDGKYAGGEVLKPSIGQHDNVVLVDVLSMYPSIVAALNLCFSNIKPICSFHKNAANLNDLQHFEPNDTNLTVFAGICSSLLYQRKNDKQKLKVECDRLSDIEKNRLNIEIKVTKLLVNAMCGCIGSQMSPFYFRKFAETITGTGRNIIKHGSEIVINDTKFNNSFVLIYGDTDSLMFKLTCPHLTHEQQSQLCDQMLLSINNSMKGIKFELESRYKRVRILEKKRYIALDFNNKYDFKGIEIEQGGLCAAVTSLRQQLILDIFTNNSHLIESRIVYFVQYKLCKGFIPIKHFIIYHQLNKPLHEYKEDENVAMPQIQAARIRQKFGYKYSQNEQIGYIMCYDWTNQKDGMFVQAFPAEIAVPLIEKQILVINVQWYIENQFMKELKRLLVKNTNQLTNEALEKLLKIN